MKEGVEIKKTFGGVRFIVAGASLVVVIAGLRTAQTFLVPFLFAMFLAILGSGPVNWLQKKRVPAVLSVIVVALISLGVFILIGVLLGQSVNDFTGRVPYYQGRLTLMSISLNQWFEKFGFEDASVELFESIEPAMVLDLTGKALKGLVTALSKTFLVLVIMIFMLVEAAEFQIKLRLALGESVDPHRFEQVAYDVKRYLAIKTVTSTITGCLVGSWVAMMGVDFPLLWGLVAFLLNYIPFIGSIIAAIPAIILAAIQLEFSSAVTLGIGYLIVNIGVSNFLEPVLMGRRLGLSALVVFLSLVFWGFVWGPAGALMSVPLTMIVKILLEHSEDFRWIAIIMGSKPKSKSKPSPE